MILTRQKRIPWLWVFLITTTTGVNALVDDVSGSALTFTMKKFVSDPAAITFLASINIAFNFLVAPYTAWKSDRIWTRFGRRKPFLLVGWSILIVALIATPLSPSLWALIASIIVWQFAVDFGYTGTWSPLFYEVVPSIQRGRAVVIKRLLGWGARLFYNLVLIGQFDAIHQLKLGGDTFRITGEQVIYFTTAGMVLLSMLHLLLNVRELPPEKPLPHERFSITRYFGSVFGSRQWLLIYLLMFCQIAMTAGLGALGPLLTTEQFGYTKQRLGELQVIGATVSMCIVLCVAWLIADRFDRLRVFQVAIVLSTMHPLGFWFFVKFVSPGQIPTPFQLVAWSVANSIIDSIAALSMEPLFYDLTPRDKMGTMNSGFALVQGILKWLVLMGVGFWVKYYTVWFGPGPHGGFDYMSGYLYVFALGILGCIGTFYFSRERKQGKVVEYGKGESTAKPSELESTSANRDEEVVQA